MTEPRWPAEKMDKIERTFFDAAKIIPPAPGPGAVMRQMYLSWGLTLTELKATRARLAKARRKG